MQKKPSVQENFNLEWKHISLTALVSSLLSVWTKARAGDRQDAAECADRAFPPSGVPEAADSNCSEWKQSDPLQVKVQGWPLWVARWPVPRGWLWVLPCHCSR